LINSYLGLSSKYKIYNKKDKIRGRVDKRISNRQSPDSKSGDKQIWVKKKLNNWPREKEMERIAINLPRFLLGVNSVNIVQAKGAKKPIRKDDIYII